MFIDIDHIQLAAPKNSETAYRHFFHDILGIPEIEKPDNLKNEAAYGSSADNMKYISVFKNPLPPQRKHIQPLS